MWIEIIGCLICPLINIGIKRPSAPFRCGSDDKTWSKWTGMSPHTEANTLFSSLGSSTQRNSSWKQSLHLIRMSVCSRGASHNPALVPGGEGSGGGMWRAGSDETQMVYCFPTCWVRAGEDSKTNIFRRLKKTKVQKERPGGTDKKQALWNLREGVGVYNGWGFDRVEIITTHDLVSLSLWVWLCGCGRQFSGFALLWEYVLSDLTPLEGGGLQKTGSTHQDFTVGPHFPNHPLL